MAYRNILFSIEAGVARLTLNRPEKLNSLDAATHAEIRTALASIASGGLARVLLLTANGRAFCAGQDLSAPEIQPAAEGGEPPDLGATIERDYKPLITALRTLPCPVVCAVNGVAAGAGANIALACDIVLAARSANFTQAFCKIGLLPDAGGTLFLPQLLGTARALGLALLGDKLSAEQAEQWGLIWRCVEDDALAAQAEECVQRLARAPTRALVATREAIHTAATNTLAAQLDLECQLQRTLGRRADYREGVLAFRERRAPDFTGC